MVEFANTNDKNELSSLWQMTFLEDCQVIEHFFDNIFKDTVTPVIRIDGEIASSLFLLPCKIGEYEGKCVYCAMTRYSHRGKGYMKELLDFSYNYCLKKGFDFLFLVPAEESLFDYYGKCGFENFGIARTHIFDGTEPEIKEKLSCKCELEFNKAIIDYWKNSCIVYGGEITSFGLVFDDDEIIIRNAKGNFSEISDNYKKEKTIVQGDITFGENYSPAMIKTKTKELLDLDCYIGITLE